MESPIKKKFKQKAKLESYVNPTKLQAPVYSQPVPLNSPVVLINNKPVALNSDSQPEQTQQKIVPKYAIKSNNKKLPVVHNNNNNSDRSKQSLEAVNRSLEAVNRSLERVNRQIVMTRELQNEKPKQTENRAHWNQNQVKGYLQQPALVHETHTFDTCFFCCPYDFLVYEFCPILP